jgi:hypothetical protein
MTDWGGKTREAGTGSMLRELQHNTPETQDLLLCHAGGTFGGLKLRSHAKSLGRTADLTVRSQVVYMNPRGRLLSQSVPTPLGRRRSAVNGLLVSSCHADRAVSTDRSQRGTASFDIIESLCLRREQPYAC